MLPVTPPRHITSCRSSTQTAPTSTRTLSARKAPSSSRGRNASPERVTSRMAPSPRAQSPGRSLGQAASNLLLCVAADRTTTADKAPRTSNSAALRSRRCTCQDRCRPEVAARGRRRARGPAEVHQAALPLAERQGRAPEPDPADRMGLLPGLHQQRRPRRRPCPWLEHCNTQRRHSALGGHPPITRLLPT